MAEIALLVWANIHINNIIKEEAIPTPASSTVPKCPIIAVSTSPINGSATPATIAGKANLLISDSDNLLKRLANLTYFKYFSNTIIACFL